MNEKRWDEQFMEFLKKTADDVKAETQRLMHEVTDPEKQEKLRATMEDFRHWAKESVNDAADFMDSAVKKAESAFVRAQERIGDRKKASKPTKAAKRASTAAKSAKKPGKTVGRKKSKTTTKRS